MNTNTETININTDKVNEMTARRVIEARALLAEAKAEAEKAEEAFRALNTDAVILEDGTKVAIVEQNRRSIDQAGSLVTNCPRASTSDSASVSFSRLSLTRP